jgi:hypothetical protein
MDDRHLELLLDIKGVLGRIDGKVSSFEKRMDDHEASDDEAHARIASLEETRSETRGSHRTAALMLSVVWTLTTALAATVAYALAGK